MLRFRVIDAALREVEGASVGIWAADAHGALPAAARLVTARSVGMGQFEVELQPEFRDRIRELAAQATAPGFAHGWLGTLAPDGVNTITLQPCVRVRFRCLGEGGEPLQGVRVALCVTPGFRDESLEPGEPVGPPDVSEHCATSGADGLVTIDGLVPRLYLLDIRHPHALLVTKLPQVDGIRVERDAEHELQFREALVAACVVEGDPTLVLVDRPRSLRLPNLARCYPSGMIAGLRRQLRPGDEGGFRVQFGFDDGRQPGPMQVTAFVPGAGWLAQEIPFVRAREAKVLRIQKPDLVGVVGGVVTIRLSEPDGTPSLVDLVQLEVKELTNPPPVPGRPMRLPTFRDVAPGSAIVLPSGRYEVEAPMSAQGLVLSGETTFQVSDGSTLHVHLRAQRRMAAVRPTAWTPEGVPLRFFRLGLTDRASGVRFDPLFTIASSTVFVPAGEYTAETVAQGYEPMVFPIDVGAPPFVWAETIVLSRTAR